MKGDFNSDITSSGNTPSIYVPPEKTVYEPELWASHYSLAGSTGTLAYACNCPSMGMALPGNLNSKMIYDTGSVPENLSTVQSGLIRDGATMIPYECIPSDGGHVIALIYGEVFEAGKPGLLLLRRDQDGWSYKHDFALEACQRRRKVLDVDFAGKLITDPREANFLGLNQFGGVWAFPYAGVPFKPRLEIPSSTGFEHYPAPEDF